MESLPNEVLIEIFDYLKFFDLKNLLGTCKKYNSIISETAVLMDKFRLVIDEKDMKLDATRKYRNIKIKYKQRPDLFTKQLDNLWPNIVDLSVDADNSKIHWSQFSKLLNLTQKLKHLKLDFLFSYHDQNELKMNAYPRLQLDSLTLMRCVDDVIVNFFQNFSTKKLEISYKLNCYKWNKSEALKKFLKCQTVLEHLVLKDLILHEFANIFDEEMINANFKLKTLDLNFRFFIPSNLENFKKFLRHQTSLRKVSIQTWEYSQKYLDSYDNPEIFNTLGETQYIKILLLKSLKLNFNPMLFIETFTFDFCNSNRFRESLRNFNVIFPNCRNLTIKWDEQLKFVKQLTELEPTNCNEMIISQVRSLTLEHIDFKNTSPFDYADIENEKLKFAYCQNINWLFDYLQIDGAKFYYLELEDVQITQHQHQFLESLTRGSDKKINELKIYLPMRKYLDGDCVNVINLRQEK